MDNANELEQVIQIVRGVDRKWRQVPLDVDANSEVEVDLLQKDFVGVHLPKDFVGVLISGHTLDDWVQSL